MCTEHIFALVFYLTRNVMCTTRTRACNLHKHCMQKNQFEVFPYIMASYSFSNICHLDLVKLILYYFNRAMVYIS